MPISKMRGIVLKRKKRESKNPTKIEEKRNKKEGYYHVRHVL